MPSVPELDRYAPFLLSAFAVTWVVLGGYLLLLRSRLGGLRRQIDALGASANHPPPGRPGSSAAPGQPG